MNTRLDKFLQAEQLTPAKFADIIGVQRSSISHIISGRNKPSFDFIQKLLAKYPRLNSEWLILGKGEMYKQMHQASLFEESASQPSLFDSAAEEHTKSNANLFINTSTLSEDQEYADRAKAVTNDTENIITSVNQMFGPNVDQIVVFYKDRTFRSYYPSPD